MPGSVLPFFVAFVVLLKNQQHPTYGLGKVRTTGGSDNTARRTEEYHRTGEMGGEWVRAAGWGGVVYSMALCSCGRMAPCGGIGGWAGGAGGTRLRRGATGTLAVYSQARFPLPGLSVKAY